eukprot:Transcript_9898.p1 GENE.Transcript_9898~~Transcript_9898.p1  ORF type:complete len:392 (+),score=178.95 Transcript_9898:261-1436(+)
MPSGIVFALGALVCAALNDIVFKKAAASGLSVGWFASMIGTTWGVVQVVGLFLFKDELLTDWNDVTLMYAPWVAVILAAANLAIIEALAGIPASAGSTVYRLNSVGVVLGGWLLLGEPLSSLKLGGVSSGVVAVLLMYAAGRAGAPPATTNKAGYRPTGGEGVELQRLEEEEGKDGGGSEAGDATPASPALGPTGGGASYYYLIAVLASALRASYGVISKQALQHGANSTQLVLSGAAGWCCVGALYAIVRERSFDGWRNPTCLRYGSINGLLQMGNIGLLNLALMQGSASIVVPVANCSFAMTLTISVLFGMESVDRYKGAAIGMAILCVLLLAQAAAQASHATEEVPRHHRHRRWHRGARALAELEDVQAAPEWHEGAWMLAPALLQLL